MNVNFVATRLKIPTGNKYTRKPKILTHNSSRISSSLGGHVGYLHVPLTAPDSQLFHMTNKDNIDHDRLVHPKQ